MKKMKAHILLMLVLLVQSVSAQKIGVLLDSYFIDRWYIDQRHLEEKIKELGGTCVVENANGEVDEQIRLGRKLIADGVDVLIIVPVDSRKAAAIVEDAKAAKVKVIAYDRMIMHKQLDFYISYDNTKVGRSQASYALGKVPSGNYLLVNGPVSDNNAILFRQGQLDILNSHVRSGKVKILGDIVLNDWNEVEAMMTVDEFLSKSPKMPDVIIAGNDALATGVLQALPASLLGKVVITGQDAESMAVRNIVKGDQSMTIYKPIKPLAHRAAEIAVALALGKPVQDKKRFKTDDVEVDAILLDPVVVDKTNYKATVVKDGHVKGDLK